MNECQHWCDRKSCCISEIWFSFWVSHPLCKKSGVHTPVNTKGGKVIILNVDGTGCCLTLLFLPFASKKICATCATWVAQLESITLLFFREQETKGFVKLSVLKILWHGFLLQKKQNGLTNGPTHGHPNPDLHYPHCLAMNEGHGLRSEDAHKGETASTSCDGYIWPNGIISHQPRFRFPRKGIALTNPTWGRYNREVKIRPALMDISGQKFNSSPLKIGRAPKRKLVFQVPTIIFFVGYVKFWGVSFLVGYLE